MVRLTPCKSLFLNPLHHALFLFDLGLRIHGKRENLRGDLLGHREIALLVAEKVGDLGAGISICWSSGAHFIRATARVQLVVR